MEDLLEEMSGVGRILAEVTDRWGKSKFDQISWAGGCPLNSPSWILAKIALSRPRTELRAWPSQEFSEGTQRRPVQVKASLCWSQCLCEYQCSWEVDSRGDTHAPASSHKVAQLGRNCTGHR